MTITTRFLLSLALFMFFQPSSFAQETTENKAIQQFYTAYLNSSKPAWKIALTQLGEPTAMSTQLLLAKGYYGAAGTAMANKEEDLAEEFLNKAETLAKKIIKKDKKQAEAHALLSTVYGLKIALSPIKGMLLGGKSAKAAQKGIELAPENPFTNFVQGNYLFYTPSMFGGDAKKSIDYLEKSKTKYESQSLTNTWEYMNVLALLGQAYHGQKAYKKAKTTYETALKAAPNFGWVKYSLLPKTEKALAQ